MEWHGILSAVAKCYLCKSILGCEKKEEEINTQRRDREGERVNANSVRKSNKSTEYTVNTTLSIIVWCISCTQHQHHK